MRTGIIVTLCSLLALTFCLNLYQAIIANDLRVTNHELLQQVQDIHEHVESMPVEEEYTEHPLFGDYQIYMEKEGFLIQDQDEFVTFIKYNKFGELYQAIQRANK